MESCLFFFFFLWLESESSSPIRESPRNLCWGDLTSGLTLMCASQCRVRCDLSPTQANAYTSGYSLGSSASVPYVMGTARYCGPAQPASPPQAHLYPYKWVPQPSQVNSKKSQPSLHLGPVLACASLCCCLAWPSSHYIWLFFWVFFKIFI